MSITKCPVETYFDTADFLSFYSHIISIIALPTNIFGIWLIIHKTPIRMKNMKNVMLNCHVWGLIGDLMLGTFTIPYVFFPIVAGSPLGILTSFWDVNAFFQTYVAVACIGEVGSSIVFMFENRQFQTVTSTIKIISTTSRRIFYSINFLFPIVTSLISLVRIPDQDSAKIEILRELPCPTVEYYRLPTIIVTTDAKTIGLCLFLLLVFYSSQVIFFIGHASFYLCISTKAYVSAKTKRLKQKYFLAVCVQVMIPFTIIFFPVAYFTFSIVTDYYDQTLNNLCFLIMSTHGFCATIATVLIYENYRSFVLEVLRLKRDAKVRLVQTRSMAETTYI